MYACGAGGYAEDGSAKGKHGVFTEALLDLLDKPGLNLVDMCESVRNEVKQRTSERQIPDFLSGGGILEMKNLQKIALVAADPEPITRVVSKAEMLLQRDDRENNCFSCTLPAFPCTLPAD